MKKAFIIFTAALLAASCSKNTDLSDNAPADNPSGAQIAFTYANPTAATRAAGDPVAASDAEKAIYDMDVFMFLADGTFVRQLTAADYTLADSGAGTTSLTLTDALLAQYGGQRAVFYFVANNVASTGGVHIASFDGTSEDQFRELLTAPAPISTLPWAVGLPVPISVAAGTHGMLMTGRSDAITLAGKRTETITLKRRAARFDVINPGIADGISIDTYFISDAPTQAPLFANSATAPALEYKSIESIWEYQENFDAAGCHSGAFYLYPTTLDKTVITIQVRNSANLRRIYTVESDIAIEANKRYTIEFTGTDFIVGGDIPDWQEG
ncbi:hypothetical protein LJC45_01755 [Alistipes sp. OttesenSCG-928-B03]|nr:hypothetical protein [Alistipes sp. OttesenSCG-928-B03]